MIAPVYIVAALARATPNDPQIICSVSGSVVACCLISASKDRMQSAIAAIANTGSVTFSANSFSELEEEFSASEKVLDGARIEKYEASIRLEEIMIEREK
tara:strand:- start:290 stop:589 length:300 start_codon:yes stop_codon:yes gene_type:complete